MDEAEAKRRMSTVYDLLRDCVGCAVVFPSRDAGPEALTGAKGTVSFIQSPERAFIVTCAHVWDGFLAKKKDNPKAELVVMGGQGKESFLISDAQEIDKDTKDLDLVTLHIGNLAERLSWAGKRFFQAQDWPLSTPAKDDTVIALGYPGEHQKPDEDATAKTGQPVVQLRPAVVIVTVSSVSTRQFVLAENDDKNPRRGIKFDTALEDLKSMGGASGAAYFLYTPKGPRFAGIQYEARGEGVESAILVSRTSYLRPDGTIDRSLLP
jgi:hypothetical protein